MTFLMPKTEASLVPLILAPGLKAIQIDGAIAAGYIVP